MQNLEKQINAAYARMEKCAADGNIPGYMNAKRDYSILCMKRPQVHRTQCVEPIKVPIKYNL